MDRASESRAACALVGWRVRRVRGQSQKIGRLSENTLTPAADAQAGRGTLLDHLAAETEDGGRPSAGRGPGLAGGLDQRAGLDQAAEILLVQMPAGDRLHGGLQVGQGELARHQLENHRTVFELGAQPRDGGRQDTAMVVPHRLAQGGQVRALERGLAAVVARLLDQPGFVEQFVAVEHLLLVPWASAGGETLAQAFAPAERTGWIVARLVAGPGVERGQDRVVENVGAAGAPVLPREEAVPWLEPGARRSQRRTVRQAGERQIADRDRVRPAVAGAGMPAAIAEGAELLDIADRKPGLRLHPGA